MRRLTVMVLLLVVLPFAADALYAVVIHFRMKQWERSIVRDEDGVRLNASGYHVGEGRTALLFVPGFAGPPNSFRPFTDILGSDFSCYAMRLPGIAEPVTQMRRIHHEQWIHAVIEKSESLKSKYEDVWLVGHSMGASVIICALHENPDLVDGIVLVAPLIRVAEDRSPLLPPRTWFDVVRRVSVFSDVIEMHMPLDAVSGDAEDLDDRDRFVSENMFIELFAVIDRVHRADTLTLDHPVLMVLAPGDRVVKMSAAESYLARIEAPVRKVYYDHDSAHVIPIDGGREAVAHEIRRFIIGRVSQPEHVRE